MEGNKMKWAIERMRPYVNDGKGLDPDWTHFEYELDYSLFRFTYDLSYNMYLHIQKKNDYTYNLTVRIGDYKKDFNIDITDMSVSDIIKVICTEFNVWSYILKRIRKEKIENVNKSTV